MVVAVGKSDENRCRLFLALREYEREQKEIDFALKFAVRPSNVFAARHFKTGATVDLNANGYAGEHYRHA